MDSDVDSDVDSDGDSDTDGDVLTAVLDNGRQAAPTADEEDLRVPASTEIVRANVNPAAIAHGAREMSAASTRCETPDSSPAGRPSASLRKRASVRVPLPRCIPLVLIP